jgi:hypothetical protein
MATGTWQTRELPILEAIAAAEAAGEDINSDDIPTATGIPQVAVTGGLRALLDAGMIAGARINTFGGFGMLMIRLREKGRRAVGQWPTGDPVSDLVRLIEARELAAADPLERGRLRALLDAVVDVGKGTASDLLASLIRQTTGMP